MLRSISSFISNPFSRSVGIVFAICSLVFGSWVTRLPDLKERLELSDAKFGLALLFIPLGATALLPFYSTLIKKLGERNATIFGTIGMLIVMPLPTLANSYFWLLFGFFTIGLFNGIMNVGMNGIATEIERRLKRSIMSTCHGFFSLFAMVGAATGSIFSGMGVSSTLHLVIICSIGMLPLYFIKNTLVDSSMNETAKSKWSMPPLRLLLIVFIGFCIMLGEGAIADWSSIYLKDVLHANTFLVGLGYASFALAMAIGRFSGDTLIMKFGGTSILHFGISLAIVGLSLVLIGPIVICMIGFFLVGLGYSCIVPILYGFSANTHGVSPSKGIAAVASSGYIGFSAGPVAIGLISESFGLRTGFLGLTILTFLAVVVSFLAFSSDRKKRQAA